MMRSKRITLFTALAILIAVGSVRGQSLTVGDPAPNLEVKSFVKGEPVSTFEHGKTYVVEFWATWCGPCRTSIPHLTELQKKHPEVKIVGVSVWEQDQDGVKPFVDKMGDKMAYRVAMDSVPDKSSSNEGAMAKSWMTAAGQDGIPAAFVINGDGKVAWIGHPMEMDKPLEKIAKGDWDLKVARAEYKTALEQRAKLRKFQIKLVEARKSNDPKRMLAAIDEISSEIPEMAIGLGPIKLTSLIKLDQQDKALDFANELGKGKLGESPQGLNALAWAIVDPDAGIKPSTKLIKFAVETARHADELAESKDPAIADTLAKAYFDSSDTAKAVETQERAVRLAKGTAIEKDKGMKDRLEKYKEAAKQP